MNLPIQSQPVFRNYAPSIQMVLAGGINPSACGGYKTCASMTCNAQTCTSYGKTFSNPFNGSTGTGECCANIFTRKGCCCLNGQTVCK
ncbi:MAG: hypothetical protein GC192_22140 [Bacteroidetes bacterium]|nr:hypothetical protein [Bacteroidota bacterium]